MWTGFGSCSCAAVVIKEMPHYLRIATPTHMISLKKGRYTGEIIVQRGPHFIPRQSVLVLGEEDTSSRRTEAEARLGELGRRLEELKRKHADIRREQESRRPEHSRLNEEKANILESLGKVKNLKTKVRWCFVCCATLLEA